MSLALQPAQQFVLNQWIVCVLGCERCKKRLSSVDFCFVKFSELIQEDAERPEIGDDVMHGQQQDVTV